MPAPSATDVFLFGSFRLDPKREALARRDEHGVFAPLAAGSRALAILGVLVERAGELVTRREIMAAVWPGTTVEDSNLNVQVAALCRILDRGRTEGGIIQTYPGAATVLRRRWRGSQRILHRHPQSRSRPSRKSRRWR